MTDEPLALDTGTLDAGGAARAGSSWLRLIAAFLATTLAGVLLAVGLLAAIQVAYAGKVLPGVRVGGVDLSGLDRAAAAARLDASLTALDGGHVTLALGRQGIALGQAALGRGYDTETMLDAAFAVGRSGDLVARASDQLYAMGRGTDLGVRVRWDSAALEAEVARAANRLDRRPTDAAVLLDAA